MQSKQDDSKLSETRQMPMHREKNRPQQGLDCSNQCDISAEHAASVMHEPSSVGECVCGRYNMVIVEQKNRLPCLCSMKCLQWHSVCQKTRKLTENVMRMKKKRGVVRRVSHVLRWEMAVAEHSSSLQSTFSWTTSTAGSPSFLSPGHGL